MRVLRPILRIVLCTLVLILVNNAGSAQDKQTGAQAAPVTYEGLRQLLRTGQSEEDILKLLERSPLDVGFVLGDGQVAELKKMRVSDEFLDGLQKLLKNRTTTLASDVTDLVLILDCSGSMSDKTKDGPTKMEAAQKVVTELIRDYPEGRRLSLVVYGHDRARECEAVDVVRPLSVLDRAGRQQLIQYVADLKAAGHTPIARALSAAAGEVAQAKGLPRVVLITDGMESCHGDPVQAAADLVAKTKANVDVIGFALKPEETKAIDQIAKAGRGTFYNAQTAEKLRKDLRFVAQVAPQPEQKPVVAAPPEEKLPANLSPVLQALTEDLNDKSGKVRRAAAESLGKQGEKARPAVVALVLRVKDDVGHRNSFSYNGDKDGCCKAAALDALKKVGPDKVAAALFGARQSKNVLVKNWASDELTKLSTEPDKQPPAAVLQSNDLATLVKELVSDLKENDQKTQRGAIRRTAAECLGKLGDKAKEAVPALMERVADDVGHRNSFTYNGDNDGCCKAAALASLKKLAPDKVQEALLKARKSKNDLVREWATKQLAEVN
jgi:uncharacterized protein YegL